MPHEYLDWFNVKDPHPAALPNLQKIVDFMIAEKAIHNAHTVSIYAIAKHLDKQHKQAAQLLRGRPGFVEVHRDGKFQGYYYDYLNFGDYYPSSYRDLKRIRVLLSEDIKETMRENVQEFNERMPEMAKQLARAVEVAKQPDPDFVFTEVPGRKQVRLLLEFPLTTEDANMDESRIMLLAQEVASGNKAKMTPLAISFLSFIHKQKEKSV